MVLAGPERELRSNEIINERVSHLVVSDSLQPCGLHHARLPCPSPSPGVCSDSCLLSWWGHPTISSSVTRFSSRVFCSESALCIRWPEYWSFSISPSNEYSGLISFTIDWFDLFAVKGSLKSFLQHHSSKALILQCSAFFTVQLSYKYMIIGKTIALTIQTFVSKVNWLLNFVIGTLPRSKHLLISWL